MESGEREAIVKAAVDAVDFPQMMKEAMESASNTGTQKDS
jgi:hypothetical protein